MLSADSPLNPWKPEDEHAHSTSSMEWWAVEAFFSTSEKKKYSLKAALNNWQTKKKTIGTNFVFTLFDQQAKTILSFDKRDDSTRIICKQDTFDIGFKQQHMKGRFPNYVVELFDEDHDILLELQLKATAYPRWVAQQATNGWLPIGLGFYRYGFIPKCDLQGTMTIKKEKTHIKGTGYFEHVWGDFTYHKTGAELGGLKKTLRTYTALAETWIHQNTIKIPTTIGVATENNPLGYDWAWAVLDNGWTLFYGNILFWVMQGPAAGSLIVSKDGKTYDELFNVQFSYLETKQAEQFSFRYPTVLQLHAKKDTEQYSLCFTMEKPIREYTVNFKNKGYWKGLVICEAPGRVTGEYTNGTETIPLQGVAKIEPQRQVSTAGHNTLLFGFLKPPQGIGVSLSVESELLNKKGGMLFHLLPKPRVHAWLSSLHE